MDTSEGSGEDATDKLLVRLREACLFLIKSDSLALAALGTLASVLKIEARQAIEVAASLSSMLKGIGFLLVGSLSVWALLVMTSASVNAKSNVRISFVSRNVFGALVLVHTGALCYGLGYLDSYLGHVHVK